MISSRKPDWAQRLNAYMRDAQNKTWGSFDCARFVGGAVEAMTGDNPHLIEYDDPLSAAKALREHGSGTLYNYMRRQFGNTIDPAFARRGDVMEFGDKSGVCLGIMFGKNALFLGETGFIEMQRTQCKRAWQVPF